MNMNTTASQTWTQDDDRAATAQGWGLMAIDAEGKRMQIQKCDESNTFADDLDAIAFVQTNAAAGDALANKALQLYDGISDADQREIAVRVNAK